MATSLDMSLDDLIKRSSSQRGRGRWRGRGQGQVQVRSRGGGTFLGRGMGRFNGDFLRVKTRPSPYKIAKSFSRTKDMTWRRDLFDDSIEAAGTSGVQTGTKLYISNLDYGISNADIRELFSEVGDLMRCSVHYDGNGRPSGSAEVVYTRRSDAIAALKRYNNVQLDGKPMKVEVIGALGLPMTRVNVAGVPYGRGRTVMVTPQVAQGGSRSFNHASGINRGGGFQRGRGRGSFRGSGRGRGTRATRGRGRGHGHGGQQSFEKSANELDKELESYRLMNR
ncbi:THO complex subunit 4D-like [Zingiber officinale]|uniref:THO complex subunit 4D-like n=1 Tax=Zingiber officinale TaxID=94328 RepID=UPI001C4C244B|nr:THO complex subunit 4D-like [Zingiber officinale]XP_042391322.1 THO complex subunit 4D-like [Zingiber officinale]XP_042391323.1 THO complex subunit 4D-like [Zingiber officinale]